VSPAVAEVRELLVSLVAMAERDLPAAGEQIRQNPQLMHTAAARAIASLGIVSTTLRGIVAGFDAGAEEPKS